MYILLLTMSQGRWSRYCYLKKIETVWLRFLLKVENLVSTSVTIFVNLSPELLIQNHTS